MRAAFEVIGAESRQPRPGSDVVTARLADVLVVQVVRSWLESDTNHRGWVAGLRDPLLGRALASFHAEPGAPGPWRCWPPRPGCRGQRSPPGSATGSASHR